MAEIFNTRPYNDLPYLVIPDARPFKLKFGNQVPTLRALVYQRTDLFGDACPLDLGGLTIRLNLYNKDGVLIGGGPVIISNFFTSEIEYVWNQFDFRETGVYYGELIFKDAMDDTTFVLPDRTPRIEIIVF